jgi:hypothetical protein
MKKIIVSICLLVTGITRAQDVGMSCQYFPGVQFGFVSVKAANNPQFTKYKFGAGLPILLVDRIANHWYTNIDFSALYYGATQTNKGNDDRVNISKAEGAFCAGRVGYLFGDGDNFRLGFSGNFGMSTSNLDSLKKPLKQRSYLNYGLGLVAYKKFGKFRVSGKLGYELYRRKNFVTKGGGFYLEGTIGYSFYQKYGISVSPCFYSKKLDYIPLAEKGSAVPIEANGKVRSFVLRVGLTKFF